MIKYCLEKWDKNKKLLEEDLKKDASLFSCDYLYIVKKVVQCILNDESQSWDVENITTIDNGDYQGTLLFTIPAITYQPAEYEYLMTYVGYGSCSGCDLLQGIRDCAGELPTPQQVSDYMTLCKDLITNIIKPYNTGWRDSDDFSVVKIDEGATAETPLKGYESKMFLKSESNICSNCGHSAICSLKDDFSNVKSVVHDVSICRADNGIQNIRDMDWVTVAVNCKHFAPRVTIR